MTSTASTFAFLLRRTLAGAARRRLARLREPRYLLGGIGVKNGKGADLVSYLAFEPVYVNRLLELGFDDTMARRREIEAFLGVERRERARG